MNLKFTIASNNVESNINDESSHKYKKTFIQEFNCGGHTTIRYGALSAPLREILELGFAWAYGSSLPSYQNDEFHRLCEEVLSSGREKCRDDYSKYKTSYDHQVDQLP